MYIRQTCNIVITIFTIPLFGREVSQRHLSWWTDHLCSRHAPCSASDAPWSKDNCNIYPVSTHYLPSIYTLSAQYLPSIYTPVYVSLVPHVLDDVPPAALHHSARQVSLHAHQLYVHPGPGDGLKHLTTSSHTMLFRELALSLLKCIK